MTIRRYITPIFALTLLPALSERILAQEIRPDFSVGTPLPEGLFNPTAPDVSAMMRYGGRIGTSFYTGAAHLSIPVFDYENADISLPISLEYDCNGYKPGVTASTLGYGWHLSVGGAITREIHGLPDEVRQREYGSRNTGDADAIKDIIHMAELSNLGPGTIRHLIQTYIKRQTVLIDGYASRYASDMTLGGTDFAYSGELGREYVLYRKYDGQTRMGVEEEPDTYHFQFPGHSGSFTLGDNGRVVILESSTPAGELSISMHYNRNEPGTSTFTIATGEGTQYHFEYRDNCHAAIYGSDDDGERSVSAWRLTRIVSRTGLTATITYSDYSQMLNGDSMARGVFMENLKLWDSDGETHTAGIYADDSPSSSVIVTNFVSYGAVQSIEIPGRLSVSFGYDGSYDASKLSSIRVRNVMGTLVRSCALEYKVSGSTAVFLKKASLSGEGVYTFSYFDEDSNGFPSMELGKTDCFGYYTTAEDRPDKGTRSLRAYAESLESTRLGFDSGRTMMGMLRTVAYPTGGRDEYVYEQNDYSVDGTLRPASSIGRNRPTGGVRVARIDTYDADGLPLQSRKYHYKDSASGLSSGVVLSKPQYYFKYTMESQYLRISRETVSSVSDMGFAPDSHIEYLRVTEETSESPDSAARSAVVHTFMSATSIPDRRYYAASADAFAASDGWDFKCKDVASDYYEGQAHGNSIYAGLPLATTSYTVDDGIMKKAWSRRASYSSYTVGTAAETSSPTVFRCSWYHLQQTAASPYLSSITETEYGTDGLPMTPRTTSVSGLTDGGRVSEFNTTDSRGRIVMTQVGYLDEVPSYPTDITVTREGRVLSAARYAYDSFPTGSTQSDITILPVAVSRGVIDRNGTLTGYEEVLSVNGYDMYGNPLSVRDASGNVTEYSWGYGGLLMTGKSVNVGGGSVLMTSWAYSPLQGMTSMTAPDGTVTKYTLDKYGRLTAVMKSGFEISSYSYNVINFQ